MEQMKDCLPTYHPWKKKKKKKKKIHYIYIYIYIYTHTHTHFRSSNAYATIMELLNAL